jgi:hypothetical protein
MIKIFFLLLAFWIPLAIADTKAPIYIDARNLDENELNESFISELSTDEHILRRVIHLMVDVNRGFNVADIDLHGISPKVRILRVHVYVWGFRGSQPVSRDPTYFALNNYTVDPKIIRDINLSVKGF